MLEAFLHVDPKSRPSAEDALKFKYLQDAQIVNDYSNCYIPPPDASMFNFEHEAFPLSKLHSMIVDEVESYNTNKLQTPKASSNRFETIANTNGIYTLEGKIVDVDSDINKSTSQTGRSQTACNNNSEDVTDPAEAPTAGFSLSVL